ncbi:hypothetical protein [Rhodoblastus sp.]|uniref:hypothetical protein n=1 Tax=Rhodoblastus sp. TaxID=1962975 RepID=UPI003F9EA6D6
MTDVENLTPVAALRRSIFLDGKPARADFTRALALDGGDSPEYAQLLADIAVDLLVDRADPPQYVSAEGADWLIGRIQASQLSYPTEMRLLIETMGHAVSLPSTLSGFCLAEIEAAIAQGRPGHPAGRIDAMDVEHIRAAVYAPDENSSLHVSRDEAEALFRIAHAGGAGAIDPGFDKLFAQAVGNYLMGVAFHGTPKAAEVRELEAFENTPAPGLGSFLGAMFTGFKTPVLKDLETPDDMADDDLRAQLDAYDKERAQAENIDADETAWLVAHLARPGAPTSAEISLLAFLKQEAAAPPPELDALFRKAGL